MNLRVLVPDRWREYVIWRGAEEPLCETYEFQVGHVRWPWSGPGQWYLHHYPDMAKILREFQPDIIDIWEEPWGLVSAHVVWLRNKFLPNAKIISETEQNTAKTLPPPFEQFRKYTLANSQYVIGRSAEAITNVRNLGYTGPASVVPNAVDSNLFRPLDRMQSREQLGLKGFVVGYIGRIVEEKGLADLVDSLRYCPEHVNLLFIGGGGFKEALIKQIGDQSLDHRVTLLPPCRMDELPVPMNAIDVLALPSRTIPRWKEQFGRVIIEAQACETPVIGSNSGGIPDVVGDGGLIFPERNPKKLAEAIMRLHDDPQMARKIGRLGRIQVEERYSWKQVGLKMRSIYEALWEETSRPGPFRFAPPPVDVELVTRP